MFLFPTLQPNPDFSFFFFNDTAPTEIYTLPLHDALPILLLHAHEIRKLIGGTSRKGLTLVPLELYFKDGIAKVVIALAKAKKLHDKREDLKRRVAERELARGVRRKPA